MIFIIDTNVESLAVKEAIKLNIPIVAIIDTNSDPAGINFPIPGNDDARRAINLYCDLIKQTILDAQKNISVEPVEEPEIKKEKIQGTKLKKIEEKKLKKEDGVKEKKSISIFKKIKDLASKKSK